jgi:hypothetical protein
VTNWIEKLGRTIFEAPFGGEQLVKDAPGMAEIRLAVLDDVRGKTQRVAGREVFPCNLVRLLIRGVSEEQASVFKGSFFLGLLEEELRAGLKRMQCRFPTDLRVEVETTPDLPNADEQWVEVHTESRKSTVASPKEEPPIGRITVLRGAANVSELALDKARTNIGRPAEVFTQDGPSRVNDLAFAADDEVNRTVSREHAHITRDKRTGEYRIYNDRVYKGGNCGMWIMRGGLSQEVHRNARGARIEDGDEIHLGNAVLRFTLG